MKRRHFLQRAVLGTGMICGATTFPCPAIAQESGSANERIGVGIVGAGGMGSGDAKQAARFGTIIAVADADLQHGERLKKAFEDRPEVYQDYRQLLDRKDIDVIIQATPDHWHSKINIDAMRAGKDVYGEKPFSLTIREGQLVCRTVKETGRVFQTGTQQRSESRFQQAIELVRNGRIGKLKQVHVVLPYYNTRGGPFPVEQPPTSLDWDLYQGQAPACPYMKSKTHTTFRWWYEYAGGITTDWGNHHMDIAMWGMDTETTGPVSVEARAVFPNRGEKDCYNTPDRFFSRMMFANGIELLFYVGLGDKPLYGDRAPHSETTAEEIEHLFGNEKSPEVREGQRNGIMFVGETGRLFVNRGGVYGKAIEELKENPLPENRWKVKPSSNHMANFFDCVRSREVPVASAELEHRSVTPCHLTNISIRLGGIPLRWDPDREIFPDNTEANAMLLRKQRQGYEVG